MSYVTYTADLGWDKFRFKADLLEASAVIFIEGAEVEHWVPTPYNTAFARHSEIEAFRLALDFCGSDYYADPSDNLDSESQLEYIINNTDIKREEL